MDKLVSIIVPVYNGEAFIMRCLRSISEQNYKNIEIIVVNDGSNDGTADICENLSNKDNRIKIISYKNRGVSAARNAGIEHSSGDYLMFVDADDTLTPDAVTALIKIAEYENADIVCGSACTIMDDGLKEPEYICDRYSVWRDAEALEKSIEDHPATYSSVAKLYRKSFVGKVRFPEGMRVHEDSFFLFECFLNKPIMVCSADIVYEIYMVANSASRSGFSEKYFDILKLAEIKTEEIKEYYPEFSEKSNCILLKANMCFLRALLPVYDKKYMYAEKECVRTIQQYKNQYIVTGIQHEEKFLWIVTHHLYYLYKLWLKIKFR